MSKIDIKFKKLDPNAVIPTKAYHNDAGYDMIATSKKVKDKYIQYGTGIAMEIPDGYVGLIYPRSSVTDKDLTLKNSVGIIDAGYRGQISFRFLKNVVQENFVSIRVDDFGDELVTDELIEDEVEYRKEGFVMGYIPEEYQQTYEVGDAIGQIVFQKLPDVELVEVEELAPSERDKGSYGSTNKK